MHPLDPDDPLIYEEGEDPPSDPPTDRELLERVAVLVEKQQVDLKVLRWRTGCLYACLVTSILLALLKLLL